jgi:hypothetical protein
MFQITAVGLTEMYKSYFVSRIAVYALHFEQIVEPNFSL